MSWIATAIHDMARADIQFKRRRKEMIKQGSHRINNSTREVAKEKQFHIHVPELAGSSPGVLPHVPLFQMPRYSPDVPLPIRRDITCFFRLCAVCVMAVLFHPVLRRVRDGGFCFLRFCCVSANLFYFVYSVLEASAALFCLIFMIESIILSAHITDKVTKYIIEFSLVTTGRDFMSFWKIAQSFMLKLHYMYI